MKQLDRFSLEPAILEDETDVFDLPSKFFQDNITDLNDEELQILVNLLNKYYMKCRSMEENFDYMQHQYQVAQRKYVDLFYFSPTGYFILDKALCVLESNLTATNLLGYPNSCISGKPFDSFLVEDDIEVFEEQMRLLYGGQRKSVCEVHLKHSNQRLKSVCLESILWPDELGELTRVRTAVIDISEKRELENQVRKNAKMDAIDSLVNNIAHDFNNILHSIISNTEYLVHEEGHSDDVDIHLHRILDLSSRAADSIAQLIDIGSQSNSQQQILEADQFIQQYKSALEKFVPSAINVDWRLQPRSISIQADPKQLQLVLINLFVNSVNAMPDGGTITVDMYKHNAEHTVVDLPELEKDDWLTLRVTDTGEGISPDRLRTIFEPQFDVKPGSSRKGLSLPQVQGIMRQHSGHVRVESRVGVGTAVYLFFPIHQPSLPDAYVPVEESELINGRGKTILLVEDETDVGESFREILEYLDFRVIMAINGKDAFDIYTKQKGDIHLIITDLVMPEMDGETFIQAIQPLNPHLKVIAISGYPLAQKVNDLHQKGIAAFVQKPFTIKKMSSVISSVLQREVA